jgi:hypothetical protein
MTCLLILRSASKKRVSKDEASACWGLMVRDASQVGCSRLAQKYVALMSGEPDISASLGSSHHEGHVPTEWRYFPAPASRRAAAISHSRNTLSFCAAARSAG